MKKFFAYVKAHYGYFFWLGWLYLAVVTVAMELLSLPYWVGGLLLLPGNLITIPVATETLNLRRRQWCWPTSSMVVAQVFISLIAPLMLLLMS